ncbi:hypothetical protein HELRODRAFT_189931 [Helobdella robusta]|uniref:Uncharacterized protein n=1 Tax=Helobdella robusta TaxID=6412 RepID=T1FRH9_HELRO|nr:hypothetical protein HELRODRAFT_189931 [Helobdella robusta]ESN90639.1 hypothetical protein HELRODRAFT_189931 [Helobdella robusta]
MQQPLGLGFSGFGGGGSLLGGSAAPASSVPTGLGGFSGFGQASNASSNGFSLGGGGTSQPQQSTAFFGLPAATTSTTGALPDPVLGGGLALTMTTTSALTFGFNSLSAQSVAAATTTTNIFSNSSTQQFQGLGGTDFKPLSSGASAVTTDNSKISSGTVKSVKDHIILPTFISLVEDFNKNVRSQKSIRESISRSSQKSLLKIEEDVRDLRQQMNFVAASLQKISTCVDSLKKESTQELRNAEIAQRTNDLSQHMLQSDYKSPYEYFQNLLVKFEQEMDLCRTQFSEVETYLESLNSNNLATPAELSCIFDKLNEGFLFLAAKLQVVHELVKAKKELFQSYKRNDIYSDRVDFFKAPSSKIINKNNATTDDINNINSTLNNALSSIIKSSISSNVSSSSGVNAVVSSGSGSVSGSSRAASLNPFPYINNMASTAMTSAVGSQQQQQQPGSIGLFGQQQQQQQQQLQQQNKMLKHNLFNSNRNQNNNADDSSSFVLGSNLNNDANLKIGCKRGKPLS